MSNRNKPSSTKVKGKIENRYVESVLVENKPIFLVKDLETGEISIEKTIETDDCIFIPLKKNECGYYPYSFENDEIQDIFKQKITTEKILEEIKSQVDRYLDLPERGKILISGDILITYSMDWITTLHYPFFVGDNESGKSSVLHLGRWLNYRCLLSEDLPNAHIYNFLGIDEEGTGTICEDEAQDIEFNKEKIRTYKSSYSSGATKPRVITFSNKKFQVYYKTFCAKWFAGERLPRNKGFVERLAIIHMVSGTPLSNIKRANMNEKSELNSLRNKLLIWKIQRIGEKHEFKSDLIRRDQELWEDFIGVFENTKFANAATDVAKHYIKQRRKSITNSFEAIIFKILVDNLKEDEIESLVLWSLLTDGVNLVGEFDSWNKKTFVPDEFDVRLTPNSLKNLVEDKFQAKKIVRTITRNKKSVKITSYFFDKEILESLMTKYGINLETMEDSLLSS